MTSSIGRFLMVVCACATPFMATGCMFGNIYWSDAIEGRVVDADTGEPLEGVVVVADWPTEIGMELGGTGCSVATFEDITGPDGRFEIPEWGPRIGRRIQSSAPEFSFLKKGYKPHWRLDDVYQPYSVIAIYGSVKTDMDGKTVTLEQANMSASEYAALFSRAAWAPIMSRSTECATCPWEHVPRFTQLIFEIKADIKKQSPGSVLGSRFPDPHLISAEHCPDLRSVLEGVE